MKHHFTKEQMLKSLKRDIDQAVGTGLKMTVTILGGNRCPQANKINGMELTMEEVLQNTILPYKNCTRDTFCICCYLFHCVRDENGSLTEHQYK